MGWPGWKLATAGGRVGEEVRKVVKVHSAVHPRERQELPLLKSQKASVQGWHAGDLPVSPKQAPENCGSRTAMIPGNQGPPTTGAVGMVTKLTLCSHSIVPEPQFSHLCNGGDTASVGFVWTRTM